MIPKVIHYCWFGGKPLPKLAIKCINSWKKYCADYEIVEWNENNYKLDKANDYVKEALEAKKWAFATDYIRLDIIYNYGGIYLDTDVEVLKNLDNFFYYDGFMAFEDTNYIATGLGFAANKNNIIIKKLMDDYNGIHFKLGEGEYDTLTCPQRNTATLIKNGLIRNNLRQSVMGIEIFPSDFFCPKEYKSGRINITSNTYTIHHFDASWQSEEDKKFNLEVENLRKYCGVYLAKNLIEIRDWNRESGVMGVLNLFKQKIERKIKKKLFIDR